MSRRNKQRAEGQQPAEGETATTTETAPESAETTADLKLDAGTEAELRETAPAEAVDKLKEVLETTPLRVKVVNKGTDDAPADSGPVECVVQPDMGHVSLGLKWYGAGETVRLSHEDFEKFSKMGIVKRK